MRVAAASTTAVLLLTAVALDVRPGTDTSSAVSVRHTGSHPATWVKLTFGLDGTKAPWDGSVTARGGEILQTAPWSFEMRDQFDAAARKWSCTTVVLTGRSASSFAEPQRGVLVQVKRQGKTQLDVETQQGNFTVDVNALSAGRPQSFLEGRASAELLGPSEPLPDKNVNSEAFTEDDFPALAVDAHGDRWLAWIAYEDAAKRDHLRTLNLDDPSAVVEEIPTDREQLNPQLLTDASGTLWLFWSAPQHGNWDLWAAKRTKHGWSPTERVTTEPGTDFQLAAARGPNGDVWLAWQAFRGDNSDIIVKRLHQGRFSPEVTVAGTKANEWEPSISVDSHGTAWVGYDSYVNGNYDVFLTKVTLDDADQAAVGEPIGIATSTDFEAHASVEATKDGTVWVAYDAAGPNWGKDFTRDATSFKGRYGEPLHASRRLGLRAVVDGKLMEPTVPLPQMLSKIHPAHVNHSQLDEIKRFYELPQLRRDGEGRLWVIFRLNRQGYAGHPKMGAQWDVFATTFADGQWLEPILLPLSRGRQNQRVATAVDAAGRLHVAWSTGHHQVDAPQRVRFGALPPVTVAGAPALKPADLPLTSVELKTADTEPEAVVRGWEMHHRGEIYHVYFGDLHRHTDISLCTPTIDGSLVDAYRYALDAARLDFLAVTNHTRDTDPFPWWRTQKANDLFYVKGRFAPIYAYERSNGIVGGGHRNVFFLERDWPVFRSDAYYSYSHVPRPENNNPDVALYPHLRGKDAFTAAHTPGYNRKAQRGTWTYHDPQVEPIAEIIQTYRRDYERPGSPQWADARIRGSIAEEASLWYALARGYKLGFIASSDHHATHTSFACVWAKGPSREEIFDGLRSRRTYAATDKIVLDVRLGEAVMGEEIDAPDVPELSIHVRGTAPIDEIQVVKNRKVIHSISPKTAEVDTSFRDNDYSGGAAYYYVRVRQTDNNMAWGSPIWVK